VNVPVLVIIDSVVWAGASAVIGLIGARTPTSRLQRDNWLTRPRRIERDGRMYERLHIRWWKDRLPEAGTWFGGRSKRHLGGRLALARFAAETRRAELVHWHLLFVTPLFALWNPPALFLAMLAYAVVANVPCVAIQRYNRARIERVLRRRMEPVPA
jgi:glycosyl-4,4'-diaponeurosporenoate acyltransferase